MLTPRAFAVVGGAVLLWLASRFVGSSGLHIVAAGLLALVALSVAVARLRPQDLHVARRLSTRRAHPGARVNVELTVTNRRRTATSLVLVEDRVPAALGASPRAVLSEIPAGGRRSVRYEVAARTRGRYHVGPAVGWVTDPFDLTRSRLEFVERHELIVYPEVEDLDTVAGAPRRGGTGDFGSRQAFRTGEEFYTMRDYQVGDDLRRIHWASTARVGKLMIRQDEAARRHAAVVLLDTRARALGAASSSFERAVSAAASIGMHHAARGSTLRFATPEALPREVTPDQLLEALAEVRPTGKRAMGSALEGMRGVAADHSSLSVVTYAPGADEVAVLTRAGAGFASRLAVLVWPREPEGLSPDDRAEMRARLETARGSLVRAGWTALMLGPHGRLRDRWRLREKRPAGATAPSS